MANPRDFWAGAAWRLALRRNAASWCDLFLPALAGVSGLAAAVLLILRLLDRDARLLWLAWSGALALAAAAVAMWVARRPYTSREALARLDEVAHLHNRLVSAHAGIGPWPAPRPGVRDAARWHWPRLLSPVAVAGLLLAAVSFVQPPRARSSGRPSEEPAAWSQVSSWLQTLEEAKLADPEALRKLREQMEDLRRQKAEDWYSQDSLEAGDALRQEMEQGMRDMQTALQQSSEAVAEAARQAGRMPSSELKALSASLQQALQGLQAGNLPAGKDLLGALRNFDPANLSRMTPEQMAALQQRLSDGLKTCAQCVGPNIKYGTGPNHSRHGNNPGEGKGNGGPGGGGGTAPLDLDSQATNLHSKRTETSKDEDMSRALPGDVLAVTKGKHTVDKIAQPAAGGAISSAGEGGDAVWRDALTPEESQVLQRYFK